MEIKALRLDPKAHLPLSAQLSDQLTWLIASGAIADGDRLPPVRALAKDLGIHMHTVRASYQIMESRGLVSSRRGRGTHVLSSDQLQKQYQPPNQRTFSIGVLIPGYNMFYLPLLRGIEDAADALHSMLYIGHTQDDAQRARRYLNQMTAKDVDGVIIVSSWEINPKPDPTSVPIVYADIPDAPGPNVLLDSEKASFLATSHLIEHNHDRIGLIIPTTEWPNVAQVFRGYQQALDSAGLLYEPEVVVTAPDFSIEAGYKSAAQLLSRNNLPGAIFAASDQLAIGAFQAIKDRGLSIPKDIAVVGYNDIEMAQFINPPLTTATAPAYQMGSEAMRLLGRVLDGGIPGEMTIKLDTELMIRKSCGCNQELDNES